MLDDLFSARTLLMQEKKKKKDDEDDESDADLEDEDGCSYTEWVGVSCIFIKYSKTYL